jgi:hypothetical protein
MSTTHQRADTTLNGTLRSPATPHLWLHTGNPGAAGTANVAQLSAANIVRKPISFNLAENHPTNTERRSLSNAQVSWSGAEINAAQTITHASIWSALSAGTPEFISAVAVSKVVGSDGVVLSAGDIECAITVFVKP